MARGRGSARCHAAVLALVLLCVLLHGEYAESAVYTVGWTPNAGGWTRGKRFRAGDVLVFKYNRSEHDVVAVNGAGFKSCSKPRGARVLKSGNDRVTLARGTNYFICSIPGHCQVGMKIAVTAA